MSPSNTDSSIWLLLALMGDPEGETVTWSAQGKETRPATFTVSGSWAEDVAAATTEYVELIASIYTNYAIFQELMSDNLQEGANSVSSTVEQDRESNE